MDASDHDWLHVVSIAAHLWLNGDLLIRVCLRGGFKRLNHPGVSTRVQMLLNCMAGH